MWDADSFLDQAQELVKKATNEHAEYNTAELDRSRPVKKGAVTRRQLSEQVASNTHTMSTSFVRKVRDVQQIEESQIGEGVADMVEFKAQVMGMQGLKRPTESKPGKVFQTGSLLTDWTRTDLSYSYQALGEGGSTSQSSRVQDGGKSRHAERSATNVHSVGSSRTLTRTFTRCNEVEVAGA